MAKRDSQGLQIALILLVMVSVLLMISTIVFWNKAKNLTAETEQLRAEVSQNNQKTRELVDQDQRLKEMLGFPEEDQTKIEETYNTDMLMFGQNFPEESRNYRKLPEYLATTVQELHVKLQEQTARSQKLEQEVKAKEEDKNRLVQVEKDAHEAASKDLKEARAQFSADLGKHRTELDEIKRSFEELRQKLKGENQSLSEKIAMLDEKATSMTRSNEKLTRELTDLRTESFEKPDGKVTWVSQRTGTAYIDLGRADALRIQTTFSVYNVDQNNLARAEKKGSIEVIRVVDDHQAEVKILEDDIRNPIVSGDVIYSPLWNVGEPLHFALTGFMDIDGDGKSDRELIKRLISLNSGVVDAEVDDEGKRTGEVTVQTRYLVVGDQATEKTSSEFMQADTQLRRDAKNFGVTELGVDRMLWDLGYQKISKAVALGIDRNPNDFPPAQRAGNGGFRPRRPPPRSGVSP